LDSLNEGSVTVSSPTKSHKIPVMLMMSDTEELQLNTGSRAV